jgi:hypothetical protein
MVVLVTTASKLGRMSLEFVFAIILTTRPWAVMVTTSVAAATPCSVVWAPPTTTGKPWEEVSELCWAGRATPDGPATRSVHAAAKSRAASPVVGRLAKITIIPNWWVLGSSVE